MNTFIKIDDRHELSVAIIPSPHKFESENAEEEMLEVAIFQDEEICYNEGIFYGCGVLAIRTFEELSEMIEEVKMFIESQKVKEVRPLEIGQLTFDF